MERKLDTFNKTQDTLIQAILRIENNQVNQQANLISEDRNELFLVNHCQTLKILGKLMRLKIQISVM